MSAAPRRPDWLRKKIELTPEVLKLKGSLQKLGLHTICESARCPNLSECYSCGTATFLILGPSCTRSCRFCAVSRFLPHPPDPGEGDRIAASIAQMGLRFAVITSVTRDDLADGGAGHFCLVVERIKALCPGVRVELLVPDFQGRAEDIERVASLPIEVFGHNLETVPSLYPQARSQADYRRSLALLERAGRTLRPSTRLKSGIMVGLGETVEELEGVFNDMARTGVQILTIGQYLQPGRENLPVRKYYSPPEFDMLRRTALKAGIGQVTAGAYVRSSYLAESQYLHGEKCLTKKVHPTYNSQWHKS